MKAVLNIVAAVLVAAGLVVAVASLLTPGQVILGIDFKLAAILLVGGLILHALARALALLERMGHDLRQLRKAGSVEPPWLRQPPDEDQSTAQSVVAAMSPAAHASPAPAEAVREDRDAEVVEDFDDEFGEPPPTATESRWPEAAELQPPATPEPAGPEPAVPEDEPQSPFVEATPPQSEAELEPEEQAAPVMVPPEKTIADEAEVVSEPEPAEAAPEDQTGVASEPEPAETALEGQAEIASEPEPAGAAVEDEPQMPSEPDLPEAAVAAQDEVPGEPEPAEAFAEHQGDVPSKLKPSQDGFKAADEPAEVAAEPAQPPPLPEDAAEEHPALYVVEERIFRGKQARVLSDGTIEAETAEGWMRFEDFDHLEEYLEAMAELGR